MKKTETEHKMTVDFILYPGIKKELEKRIELILEECIADQEETTIPDTSLNNPIKAILVPHAGWSHCDKIMATAYAAVAKRNFKRTLEISCGKCNNLFKTQR